MLTTWLMLSLTPNRPWARETKRASGQSVIAHLMSVPQQPDDEIPQQKGKAAGQRRNDQHLPMQGTSMREGRESSPGQRDQFAALRRDRPFHQCGQT